jgi:hypothetical protein
VKSRARRVRICFRTHTTVNARLAEFASACGMTRSSAAHFLLAMALHEIASKTTRGGVESVVDRLDTTDRDEFILELDITRVLSIPW